MKAAIYGGPFDLTVGERPDPHIQQPTDAVVRVLLGCVCGSDLWSYGSVTVVDGKRAARQCRGEECSDPGQRGVTFGEHGGERLEQVRDTGRDLKGDGAARELA
jgi:hypothetical protein